MKKHILLVDNDKHELDYFLNALKEVPEDDGFKCTYAESLTQAQELLKLLVPHYIFLGKGFPDHEIRQMLEDIRNEGHLQEVKIYLYADPYDHQPPQLISFGMSGWVRRCRSSDKLGTRLATCLAE